MQQANTRKMIITLATRYIGLFAFLALLTGMILHLVRYYIPYITKAVIFPFGLDYGEGIVWQQALLMPGKRMYGDINSYPFIVFHYPPLYHLAVRAAAFLYPDYLSAGRALSVLSTFVIAVLVFLLVLWATRDTAGRFSLLAATIASLSIFTYMPVFLCSSYMRVDMLAVMFSFLGMYLTVSSIRRPHLLYWAGIIFLLAFYTKQTSISASIATFTAVLLLSPKQAIKAVLFTMALGTAILFYLMHVTEGRYLLHIIKYNLNQIKLSQAVNLGSWVISYHWIYLILVVVSLDVHWRKAIGVNEGRSVDCLTSLRQKLLSSNFTRVLLLFTVYLVTATLMLATTAKEGSYMNYFVEWLCIWSVFLGMIISSTLELVWQKEIVFWAPLRLIVGISLPAAIACQLLLLPSRWQYKLPDAATILEKQKLAEIIRQARKPVLSEDMVLLLRAGKEIPIEPAIFIQLTNKGLWDQQQVISLIKAGFFEFVVTNELARNSTWTPAVQNAIKSAYPRLLRCPDYEVYQPAE